MSEEFKECEFLTVAREWKSFWMNQIAVTGDQRDHDNYFRRAFGVDANMIHNIALRMRERCGDRIKSLQSQLDEQCRINGIGQERELSLMSENEKLRSALRFYASYENWVELDGLSYKRDRLVGDAVEFDSGFSVSGKLARQTLKELGEG